MAKQNQPTGKRERIDTTPGQPGGSRFIRRDAQGHFTSDQVDVGRSLAADLRWSYWGACGQLADNVRKYELISRATPVTSANSAGLLGHIFPLFGLDFQRGGAPLIWRR